MDALGAIFIILAVGGFSIWAIRHFRRKDDDGGRYGGGGGGSGDGSGDGRAGPRE